MKKIFFAIFSLFFVRLDAQTVIEGIGKFKMGKTTTSIISELKKELNAPEITKVTTYGAEEEIKTHSNKIARLIPDTNDFLKGPFDANLCPDTKVYLLTNYTIADIPFKNIILTFYNDTLVEFASEGSPEISTAMRTKYGEGNLSMKNIDGKCEKKDHIGTVSWDGVTTIAVDQVIMQYNEDCKDSMIHLFMIAKSGYTGILTNCENAAKDGYLKGKEAKKLKKLSEF